MVIYEGNIFKYDSDRFFKKACNCHSSSSVGNVSVKTQIYENRTEATMIFYNDLPVCNRCGKPWLRWREA